MNSEFNAIEHALEELKQGKMIILMDDKSRENEGDLVMAAEKTTPEAINFMCRKACGLICLSLQQEDFDRLELPMMVTKNKTPHQTAFGVSFEAATGVTTGISAHDRAHTINVATNPHTSAADIITPGHIFPLRAVEGGVLKRRGHTEGSSDLAKLAGFRANAVICEIMNEDGTMARLPDLKAFSKKYNLALIRMSDLVAYRMKQAMQISEVATAQLPLANYGPFTIKVFKDSLSSQEHVVLLAKKSVTKPLVRIHSECLTGDIFGSQRCDCGTQLDNALTLIAKEGGALLYLRQEGRGIGLINKIKAYALQQQGLDTVEANHQLGFGADERDYTLAAEILKILNLKKIRLLTNNPEKIEALTAQHTTILERIPLETTPNEHNSTYLTTKRLKLGHLLNTTPARTVSHEQ